MQNDTGFSLVELMVVVAIVGILAMVATPALVSVMPGYKLKSAATDLVSELRRARSIAIKLNRSVSVVFNTANNSYTVDGHPTVPYPYTSISDYYGSGIAFGFPGRSTPVTFPDNKITFNFRGLTTDAAPATGYYVFLQNSKGKGYRVGVKGMAANVIMESCDSLPSADDCTR